MIIDLNKFITAERPYWEELEALLDRLSDDSGFKMSLERLRRFHYLYQRTSSDLARLITFSTEPETRRYLESLVQRAYAEVHETRGRPHRLRPRQWFFRTFPRTFRRQVRYFWLALGVMLLGSLFGGLAITFDPGAKEILLPFSHLHGSPSDRVAEEEQTAGDRLRGSKAAFSSYLMTHNTRVSIFAMALGLTYGIGTIIVLFFNGIILGAVTLDYLLSGEGVFLAGWLLPHGSVEIPAIILAGQAGLVLAGALIGWEQPAGLRARLRAVSQDLVTLISGTGLLLVWAGLVEAFLSQYHEPILPYWVKIVFGLVELVLLIWFLGKSGAAPAAQGN